MTTPAFILKDTFGYDTFRPLQSEVIENVLAGNDTLAVMPTGGGKSLCYQIPALLQDGLTLVVSPLIALMKDQVDQLRVNGVPAVFLNSSLSPEAYQENLESVQNGSAKLLYVAPETLLTPRIFSLLSNLKLDLITIDEAHCISEWGHDFRPEYRQLINVRQQFPQAVCLALTATATTRVRSDITKSLNFLQSNEFVASFDRQNLFIEVAPKSDPIAQTSRFLKHFKDQSGIIYCFSRKQVDELSAYLAREGFSVRPYHAGLADAERRANQDAFIHDDVQIIVATIAFGMGINKSNVRFVVHYDLPKSIEGYYQEIGRAGRDGLPAHCLLLYSYSDVAKLNYFIKQKEGAEKQVAAKHLDAIVRYAEDEINCRRKPLLAYFGETYTAENCKSCDNCNAAPPKLIDITIPAQKFLSCVMRSGERFGAAHITNVLRGSKAEKILQHEHNKLSTYGIGADLDQKQWMHLSRQLIQLGYLSQESEFRTLTLTPKAKDSLKKRATIMGQLQEAEARPSNSKARKTELEYNHALYYLVRQKRKELADESGVPPYVIFSDKTLVEMCAYYPQSPESLLNINGVGQAKLNQFGETFLEVIRAYCKKKGLKEKTKESSRLKTTAGQRHIIVGEAYNAGDSIQQLMERHHVKMGTIINHLEKYAVAGNSLRNSDEFRSLTNTSPEEQQAAIQAFDQLGTALLKPVFEKLGGKLTYDDLRISRLIYLTSQDPE
ncbi:MAG: DNA helicase RecQ [Anaerolineaceae bacterium]|nr:DNA helicase RecQ [Anaerolineaceae bacterium]